MLENEEIYTSKKKILKYPNFCGFFKNPSGFQKYGVVTQVTPTSGGDAPEY